MVDVFFFFSPADRGFFVASRSDKIRGEQQTSGWFMAEIRGIELTRDHIGKRVVVETVMGGYFAGMIAAFDDDGCEVCPLIRQDQVARYPFDQISWWD